MIVIFGLSAQSNPLPEVTTHVWDKLLHACEYAGLAFLLARALRGEGASWLVVVALAIGVASAYGASDEWHQAFVPGRDSAITDWLADTTGAFVGALILRGTSGLGRLRPDAGPRTRDAGPRTSDFGRP
jgi:VanZ family protein